jgi:hypothetical protein
MTVKGRARGAFPPEPHSSETVFDPLMAVCSFSDIAPEVPPNDRLTRIASTSLPNSQSYPISPNLVLAK